MFVVDNNIILGLLNGRQNFMERRKFLKIITAGAIALGIEGKSETMNTQSSNEKRFLAVTMDDPNTYQTPLLSPDERNLAILKHLDSHKIRAALFVCGERVDNPGGKRLLSEWNNAGHMLGNHTYSHPYYHSEKIILAPILKI
jgi:peptidoglycan/xylan/chitin deacetylase (PgdA/CDA1 family)